MAGLIPKILIKRPGIQHAFILRYFPTAKSITRVHVPQFDCHSTWLNKDLTHQYSPGGLLIAESNSEYDLLFDKFTTKRHTLISYKYSCALTGYYK